MLQAQVDRKTRKIVEYSSGSTVISMSTIARVMHGIDDTRAFLSNKTSEAKLRLMQFFGLDITLFGGPSQPEPFDDRGGIQSARRMAKGSDDALNPNQYENDDNWRAHVRWTGPQIFSQLPEINVLCAGMGTSGTMTGLGTYFKEVKPSVLRLAVCTAPGDRVPGPRSLALLGPVEFPWKDAVDAIEEVGSPDSYALSLDLCRNGVICGPSSGFNLQGLYQMLATRKSAGTLASLAGDDGLLHCVFLCCDLPYQYIPEYFQKLEPEKFHPIRNEVCPSHCLVDQSLTSASDSPTLTSTATMKPGNAIRQSSSRTSTRPPNPSPRAWACSATSSCARVAASSTSAQQQTLCHVISRAPSTSRYVVWTRSRPDRSRSRACSRRSGSSWKSCSVVAMVAQSLMAYAIAMFLRFATPATRPGWRPACCGPRALWRIVLVRDGRL
jgi:cysteine synthase